jgi:hypothetical protein
MFLKKSGGKTPPTDPKEARLNLLQGLREKLDAALGADDPAERLLTLGAVAECVRQVRDKATRDIGAEARGWETPPMAAILVCLSAVVFGSFAVGLPGLGILLGIPAGMAGAYWGESVISKKEARIKGDNKAFFDGLDKIETAATQAGTAILCDQLPALAQSPKLEELHRRVPNLGDLFAKAFERQQQPPAPPPNAPNANKLNL